MGNYFEKNFDYKTFKRLLQQRYGKEKTLEIFLDAQKRLNSLYQRFPYRTKGEKSHTDAYIFPRVAFYQAMKKEIGDEAMILVDDTIRKKGTNVSSLLRFFTAFPLMEKVFLKLFKIMAKAQFGNTKGFKQVFYRTSKDCVKFDLYECPYCKYCRLADTPELIHTFCDSDAYCFGNLSKLEFTRTKTLEYDNKCDFELKIKR